MTQLKATRPEDVLPDHQNSINNGDITIRKGTMAAAIINLDVIESNQTSVAEKQKALAIIEELAPALKAFGLTRHFKCNNPKVQALLENNP